MNAPMHKRCPLYLEETSARKSVKEGTPGVQRHLPFLANEDPDLGMLGHDKTMQCWFYFSQHKELRQRDSPHSGRKQVGGGGF